MPKVFVSATFLILSIIIAVFLVWPKYQELSVLNVRIKEREQDIKAKEEDLKYLRNISSELVKYEQNLKKIDSALPSFLSIPSLFYFLQKESSQNGLVLGKIQAGTAQEFFIEETVSETVSAPPESSAESFSPEGASREKIVRTKTEIKTIPIELSLAGSYSDFKNFLSSLEKNAKLFETKTITFSAPSEKEESFKFDLGTETYSY